MRSCNEILDLQKEKEKLQNEILKLKETIKKLRLVIGKPKSLRIGIENTINYFVDKYYQNCTTSYIGIAIADSAWAICDGISQFHIMKHAHSYLRAHVYMPQAIVKAMDMAGGICNLKAYQIIHTIETLSKDPLQDYSKDATALPHKWRVQMVSKHMNEYAQKILPMKHYYTEHGERLEYENIKKYIYLLFWAFGLDKVAA